MNLRLKNSKDKCEDCKIKRVCIIDSKYKCIVNSNCKQSSKTFCIPIEMFLGIISSLFGIVLLFPYHTFENNEIYTVMYKIAHEEVWGIICLTIGLFQIYVTKKSKERRWRVISLSFQTFLWSFVGSMFLVNDIVLGHSLNVASTTYLCLAGLSLYTAHKL